MTRSLRVLTVAVGLLVPALAAGQINPGQGGSLLGGFAGGASAGADQGLMVGAAAAWRLSPRLATEARLSWLQRPAAEEAITAGLTALLRVKAGPRTLPFVRAGLGLYATTIDVAHATPPEFYRRRIAAKPGSVHRTFRDPAFIAGAGVDILASRFVSWRPQAEMTVVWHESQTYVVATASVQLSFHFEWNRITPSAKPGR